MYFKNDGEFMTEKNLPLFGIVLGKRKEASGVADG